MNELSHFDTTTGRAKMVDVGGKVETRRVATARCRIKISPQLTAILKAGTLEKGDAFTVAKTAGILAAKSTAQLIPMCHPLALDSVNVELTLIEERNEVRVEAIANTTAKTGVEMEAMTAASLAALTFYDMCKAVDKSILIQEIGLYKKTGGKSGEYTNLNMDWEKQS